MEEDQISKTAMGSAHVRAYHAMKDSPKIFDDFLAYRLLKEYEREAFEQFLAATLKSDDPVRASLFPDHATASAWMMQTMASVPISLCRTRYAEECLKEAVKQGVKQYVILGAGMDTFAFRYPEVLERIEVFELDHPKMQAFKLHRLTELGWENPVGLHFIPIDFMKESLVTVLKNSPYNPQALSFFSWVGVAMYLTREAVFEMLRSIVYVSPKGSMIIFDYLDPDAFIPQKAVPRVYAMVDLLRKVGESLMNTGFDPLTLAEELAHVGMRLYKDLSPLDIENRYFRGRTDYYRATEHAHIACAVVE